MVYDQTCPSAAQRSNKWIKTEWWPQSSKCFLGRSYAPGLHSQFQLHSNLLQKVTVSNICIYTCLNPLYIWNNPHVQIWFSYGARKGNKLQQNNGSRLHYAAVANRNEIIIKTIAFQSIFRCAQNINHVILKLLFLVGTILGADQDFNENS